MPGFIRDLASTVDTIEMWHQNQGSKAATPLAQSLLDVAREMSVLPTAGSGSHAAGGESSGERDNSRPTTVVRPGRVKDAIDRLSDKFTGYQQRDAHEFLGDLIDSLHDELKAAVKALNVDEDKEYEIGQPTPILLPTDKYFLLEAVETLTCVNEECKYSRYVYHVRFL